MTQHHARYHAHSYGVVRLILAVLPGISLLPASLLFFGLLFSGTPALAKRMPKGFDATLSTGVPEHVADGSIFNVQTSYSSLIDGTRAFAVGDIINVVLAETTSTSKTAVTKTQRAGSGSITPPTAGYFAFNPNALNAAAQSQFNGQGNTAQTDALNGSIAVTVVKVLPNGVLEVRGQKQMKLSQGNEWIQFSGLVRKVDIDPLTGSVLSSQIAGAHIEYSGNGSIQTSAREGWLLKFFNMISPF